MAELTVAELATMAQDFRKYGQGVVLQHAKRLLDEVIRLRNQRKLVEQYKILVDYPTACGERCFDNVERHPEVVDVEVELFLIAALLGERAVRSGCIFASRAFFLASSRRTTACSFSFCFSMAVSTSELRRFTSDLSIRRLLRR